MNRSAGILLPIFSLNSPYGIGTCGNKAYEFVDFLYRGKQKYWQILPLNPTGPGNSPYSSICSFAGDPLLIDLDMLCEKGLLYKNEFENVDFGSNEKKIDYDKLYENKLPILKLAVKRFYDSLNDDRYGRKDDYYNFVKKHQYYIEDYAVYQVLKERNDNKEWFLWDDKYKYRDKDAIESFVKDNEKDIDYQKIMQYFFFYQYYKLKKYANDKNIKIIGDIPIYVSYDSVEVWTNNQLFQLDKDLKPTRISGCPPDFFCKDGQVWNNPLYNYDLMKENNYEWWVQKIINANKMFDVMRIDHFRGFESYYSINANTKNASDGMWVKAPGMDLLSIVNKHLDSDSLIAEDLGLITDDVKKLLSDSGYPGMKVFLFGFDKNDSDNMYRPHNFIENCIGYIGTHDNETLMGFINEGNKDNVNFMKEYMHINNNEYINTQVIRELYKTKAKLVIVTVQDLLGLGNEARINKPSTVSDNNWSWRLTDGQLNNGSADFLSYLVNLYSR